MKKCYANSKGDGTKKDDRTRAHRYVRACGKKIIRIARQEGEN